MSLRSIIEPKMLQLAIDRDAAGLITMYKDLLSQRKKLDAWFDKYIEMFDRKMDPKVANTPEWKLYHKKFSEYEELNSVITSVKYYKEKVANVRIS